MSYTVLARKYRSATFDDVVGQDHVAQTLKRAIESGRIAQAFLFCGTRGTGKTSMARILAKSLNCLKAKGPTTKPCLECDSCKSIARGDDIDVIEIDAASNTQVEKTREVILDNAAYRPARSRFKIYIIDEVHMLSKASFNALLKTLEEPPDHVKFILATTEAEKVLQTIQSRCQRYDFRNIPTREIAAHLAQICKSESIEAEPDALLLLAKVGSGSMRDALSVLDRLLSLGEKKLSVEMVEQLLGLPKAQLMYDLADAIGRGDAKTVLEKTADMIARGMSADSLVASMSDHLRNLLIVRMCGMESQLVEVPGLSPRQFTEQAGKFDAVNLTQDITILEELRRNMRQSQAGRALLDATLVRLTLAEQFTPIPEVLARLGGVEAQKKNFPDVAPASAAEVSVAEETRGRGERVAGDSRGSLSQSAIGNPQLAISQGSSSQSAVPPVSAPPALNFDEEDDDLPRPGKVWDDSGPSLSEMLAQRTGAAVGGDEKRDGSFFSPGPVESGDASFANVEPVVGLDLSAAWGALLEQMRDQQGLIGLLSNAKLVRIEDEQAILRISQSFAMMIRMFEKNGRREMLCAKLSEILGRNVGVRFEVEEGEPAAASVPVAVPAASAPRQSRPSSPAPRPAPVAEAAQPAGIRITPELVEQMRKDTLLSALMDEFSATPAKVE